VRNIKPHEVFRRVVISHKARLLEPLREVFSARHAAAWPAVGKQVHFAVCCSFGSVGLPLGQLELLLELAGQRHRVHEGLWSVMRMDEIGVEPNNTEIIGEHGGLF
jgi:hypothetical protein